MTNSNNDDAYKPPPTEAEWEVFLKRSDARSAKYGELLETLIDHPDRDAIIEREMGWGSDDADGFTEEFEGALDWDENELADAAGESLLADDADDSDDDDDPFSFSESPLYHQAFDWGLRMHTELQDFMPEDCELEPDDPLCIAFCECVVVAAKIAGSHAMSADDDSLGGSIVYTKRALKSACETLAALEELCEAARVPEVTVNRWISETKIIVSAVELQIEELRARVWWE